MQKRTLLLISTFLLTALISSASIFAASPSKALGFQGQLFSNNAPVSSSVNATFTFYDSLSGGAVTGSPISKTVTVSNGYFGTQFTEADTTGVNFDQALYVQVNINGTDLSPRTALNAAPTALKSFGTFSYASAPTVGPAGSLYFNSTSNTLFVSNGTTWTTAASSTSPWLMNGSDTYFNTGNVGIGTTTPGGNLHLVAAGGPTLRLSNASSPEADVRLSSRFGSAAYAQLIVEPSFGNKSGGIAILPSGIATSTFIQMNNNVNSWYLQSFATSGFSIDTGVFGTKFLITPTGNVGIGTSTPISKLTVNALTTDINPFLFLIASSTGAVSTNVFSVASNGTVFVNKNTVNNAVFAQPDTQNGLKIIGAQSTQNSILMQAYGSANNVVTGYTTPGTPDAPTATLAETFILRLQGGGYTGSAYASRAEIAIASTENWSATSTGANIRFLTTANGGTTRTEKMRIDSNGFVGIGTTTPLALLSVVNGAVNISSSTPTGTYYEALRISNTNAGSFGNYAFFEHSGTSTRGLIVGTQYQGDGFSPFVRSAGSVSQDIEIRSGKNAAGNSGILYLNTGGNGTARTYMGTTTVITAFDVYGTSTASNFVATSSTAISSFAGLVGIGTTTPSQRLSVAGNMSLSGAFFDALNASGTAGMILSSTGSGTQWMATSTLGINSSPWLLNGTNAYYNGGGVGIGTSTPSTALHVVSAATNVALIESSANNAFLKLKNSGSGTTWNVGFVAATATNDGFYINDGTERFRILTNGNVGIGTSTPNAKLHVLGTTEQLRLSYDTANYVPFTVSSAGTFTVAPVGTNSSIVLNPTGTGLITSTNSTNSQFYLQMRNNSASSSATAGFSAMNANGISGQTTLTTSGTGAAPYGAWGANEGLVYTNTGALNIMADGGAGILKFSAGGNGEDMRLNANGFLAIGTTTAQKNLHLNGATESTMLITSNLTGSTASDGFFFGLNTNGSDTTLWNFENGYMRFATNNAERMRIDASGNVGIGTTTPTATLTASGTIRFTNLGSVGANLITDSLGNVTVSSDERLKDIKGMFMTGLDKIKLLSPILYTWKPETGYDTVNTYAGFSAQNVQSAIPEAVSTDSRGFLTLADRPILATLVNAVKELADKVEKMAAWFTDDKTFTVQQDATLKVEGKTEINGQICVENVCASKEQFKLLLQQAGNIQLSAPQQQPAANVNTPVVEQSTASSTVENTPAPTPEPVVASAPEVVEEPVIPTE
ncbi:MAG: tail fiber domain-containing protein [Patescibacteria group bacterium]